MTDHIATIREALIGLGDDLRAVTGMPTEAPGLASLSAVEAELQRLRDDPNRLDLASVPTPWRFQTLSLNEYPCEEEKWCVFLYGCGWNDIIEGRGSTPRAALAAAIERIGK